MFWIKRFLQALTSLCSLFVSLISTHSLFKWSIIKFILNFCLKQLPTTAAAPLTSSLIKGFAMWSLELEFLNKIVIENGLETVVQFKFINFLVKFIYLIFFHPPHYKNPKEERIEIIWEMEKRSTCNLFIIKHTKWFQFLVVVMPSTEKKCTYTYANEA